MEEAVLTLRSSIKASLKKQTIIRGTILGGLGISLWLFGAIALPENTLNFWGWPILLIGGILIVIGLLPYRRLSRLENRPHEIVVTDLEELYCSMHGTPFFKIALENIEEMAYLDDENRYGIGLWIKLPKNKYIEVLYPSLVLETYLKDCQKHYFCDVFLPFFSKRSFEELEEIYKNI